MGFFYALSRLADRIQKAGTYVVCLKFVAHTGLKHTISVFSAVKINLKLLSYFWFVEIHSVMTELTI